MKERAVSGRQLNGLMANWPHLTAEKLSLIQAPVLLLTGRRDMIRPRHSLWMGEQIPDAKVVFCLLYTSGLLAYFAIKLKAEIFLTGLMMNMIASGATVFIMYMLTKDKGTTTKLKSLVFPQVQLPVIKDIPFVGEVVSNHNILTYLAFLSVALVWFFINRTKLGIRIRAVGENPKAAESVGINIIRTQVTALLICGFLASLGGMYLSMGYVSWFSRRCV